MSQHFGTRPCKRDFLRIASPELYGLEARLRAFKSISINHEFGAGAFCLEYCAKSLKVCERGNGLFPSQIGLWVCSKPNVFAQYPQTQNSRNIMPVSINGRIAKAVFSRALFRGI
jgi:hypothetical protein